MAALVFTVQPAFRLELPLKIQQKNPSQWAVVSENSGVREFSNPIAQQQSNGLLYACGPVVENKMWIPWVDWLNIATRPLRVSQHIEV